MKNKLATIALSVPLIFTGLSASAFAYDGSQYAKEAKVTIEQARANALKAAPGTINDSELEKVKGHLQYAFDVQTKHGLREVTVDANSGKVAKNAPASLIDKAENIFHDSDEK